MTPFGLSNSMFVFPGPACLTKAVVGVCWLVEDVNSILPPEMETEIHKGKGSVRWII